MRAVLSQNVAQVAGLATLGDSDILEVPSTDSKYAIVARVDKTTQVSGNTLNSAPGLAVTFSMTKS